MTTPLAPVPSTKAPVIESDEVSQSCRSCKKNSFVTKVEPNDVLLGRGAPIITNEGNIRFRSVVAGRKESYSASCRHPLKNKIAQEVMDEIKLVRKGRFLRKIDDPDECKRLGVPPNVPAWIEVSDDIALLKVKQALRENDKSTKAASKLSQQKPSEVEPLTSSTTSHPAENKSTSLPLDAAVTTPLSDGKIFNNERFGNESQNFDDSFQAQQQLASLRLLRQRIAAEEQALQQKVLLQQQLRHNQHPIMYQGLTHLNQSHLNPSNLYQMQFLLQEQHQQPSYSSPLGLHPMLHGMLQGQQQHVMNNLGLPLSNTLTRDGSNTKGDDEHRLYDMLQKLQEHRNKNLQDSHGTMGTTIASNILRDQTQMKITSSPSRGSWNLEEGIVDKLPTSLNFGSSILKGNDNHRNRISDLLREQRNLNQNATDVASVMTSTLRGNKTAFTRGTRNNDILEGSVTAPKNERGSSLAKKRPRGDNTEANETVAIKEKKTSSLQEHELSCTI